MDQRVDHIEKVPGGVLPIEAQAISIAREGRTLLDSVDFRFGGEPQITVVLGPNGAGKSLLIRALNGLIAVDGGRVSWAGHLPDRARARAVGVVFQRPVLLRRTVAQNIAFALAISDVPVAIRKSKALELLQAAGLGNLADQDAATLSAGEQQRLCLARAVACAPQVLMLDEPAANLDPAATAAIEQQLRGLRDGGMPILFITHDLAQARRLADEIVFMHRGRIFERGRAREFFSAPRTDEARKFIRGELLT